MEKGRKLPAPEFCNREGGGKANPVYGRGALGNQYSGRMFYSGSGREDHVTLVQMMLTALGYSVGSAGADGKFGNDTEKAVREFQKVSEDWGGEKLNVDGLVGPETSDALNRSMVGVEGWYAFHQTEKELTGDFALLTATGDALKQPVPLDVDGTGKGKVVIAGSIIISNDFLTLRLVDADWQPMKNTHYRLEIDEEGFRPVEADTDEEGILSEPVPLSASTGRLVLETVTFNLIIVPDLGPAGELSGALMRLNNLGYPVNVPDTYRQSREIGEDPDLLSRFTCALTRFQMDNDISPTGNLDAQTEKKLNDAYG